jgi:hypothetical protein
MRKKMTLHSDARGIASACMIRLTIVKLYFHNRINTKQQLSNEWFIRIRRQFASDVMTIASECIIFRMLNHPPVHQTKLPMKPNGPLH